jgi:hypothetical protein
MRERSKYTTVETTNTKAEGLRLADKVYLLIREEVFSVERSTIHRQEPCLTNNLPSMTWN